jgi:hypothetical protein
MENQADCDFLVILFLNIEIIVSFEAKIVQTYYQHLEFSFLFILALRSRTCLMAQLIMAWSNFNPNLIEI